MTKPMPAAQAKNKRRNARRRHRCLLPGSEYAIIPRWFTVHHMRGGTLSEAGGVGPMNAVRRSTAARPLERARVRSSWAIAAPWLRTR